MGQPRKKRHRRRLFRSLPHHAVGAEVGVWKGNMSAKLLERVEPAKLVLIDPWLYQPEFGKAWYGSDIDQRQMDKMHASVVRRFASEIEAGIVEVCRAGSVDAAERYPDGYFDWVYIDANHTYEHVKADLETFARKVKPGGLIAGDDYGRVGWWEDGVTRAVEELLERGVLQPVNLTSQYLLRVPEASGPQ